MVERANRFRVVVGVVAAVTWAGSGVVEARSRLRGPGAAVEAAASHAILSNAMVRIGQGAVVAGHVHSNGNVELRKESRVEGDVAAVGRIKNRGGTVEGALVSPAARVDLPALPGQAAARAQADRVVNGPLQLVDPRIDDVLFVAGPVTLRGAVQGAGTLIATGPVTLVTTSSATPPTIGTGFSIVAYADVVLGGGATLHAAVRSAGRVMVGERATFEGWLIAERDVELARGARVVMGRLADGTPPALTLLGPPDPFVAVTPHADLTVLFDDTEPGVDFGSFVLRLDGIAVTDRCAVGQNAASCSLDLGGPGRREVSASLRDLAGNLATASAVFTVFIDAEAPEIAIETPMDGALVSSSDVTVAGMVTDDGGTAVVTVDGTPIESTNGRFARAVPLADGPNPILVSARDGAGRTAERVISVTRDSDPPTVTLRSPAAVAFTTRLGVVTVAGEASDDHGVARVEVAEVVVAEGQGNFESEVALVDGLNRIRVAAIDAAGNVGGIELEIERSRAPAVAIVAPLDLALLGEEVVDVQGTVDDPDAVVRINGLVAQVAGTFFHYESLPIGDGATLINAVATSSSGLMGVAGVTVVRDLQAPTVEIHYPVDGAVMHQSDVAVTGMVNDAVVGTVNAAQAEVHVNGHTAEVANRAFVVDRVPLAAGDNTIEVVATDPSGNVGRHAISVRRAATLAPTITVESGDGQSATAGEPLPLPLVVALRDEVGMPVPGRVVTFVADGTDGTLAGERQTAVLTDGAGRAATTLTLGRRAGHHTVRALATGIAGEALFVARALAAEPAFLVADAGDQQVGAVGQGLRAPFAVVATDEGFNRLEGVAVRFEVVEGGGRFETGEPTMELRSDGDGRATARLTLGDDEGVGGNVVRARVVGGPDDAVVTFAASGLVPRDPTFTSVRGVVLDNSDLPVPGATVTLEGTTLVARTDASGYFRLDGALPGTTHLRVSGSTVERPGVWPSLEFLITIIAGRDNDMGRPIFLPVLETENALAVDETTGGVLTVRDMPGFALHVTPGSVTFPGGARAGVITVTPVHGDKVPMPPNFGQQPRFVITIQPGGARFVPPARVTYPNVDGLLPGQVTELYSFDHDLARFVSIGPGTVTADGSRIESAPGVGIAKAGWHGGGDPARPGTCHDCGACKELSGGACVAADSRTPSQRAPDDCKTDRCRGGRVASVPDPNEVAKQIQGNCFEERCGDPMRKLDLGDAPAPRRCCGNAEINPPIGRLAGIFDPRDECCIEDGLFLVGKGPPLDVAAELCPDRLDAPDVPTNFDGCSGGPLATLFLYVDSVGGFSGDRNAPTPAGQQGSGAAQFSDEPDFPTLPVLPCDRHDDCYQTCDSDLGARDACDQLFHRDMMEVCAGVSGTFEYTDDESGLIVQVDRAPLCLAFADTYFMGVQSLGKSAFDDGQRSHCECCP